MNEDTFLGVLKYLAIEDYVHFTMLSRSFNQFFGLVSPDSIIIFNANQNSLLTLTEQLSMGTNMRSIIEASIGIA
jgi:hypothetical protein